MSQDFGRGKFESTYVTLVPERNDYEGVVTNANINRGKDGTGQPRIEITIKFREDVEQEGKGSLITYRIFKNEGDDFYNSSKLNNIIITQDRFPTYKNHFDTVDEVVQYINGLCFKFSIENEFNEYFGEDRSRVKDWGFDITAHPGYKKGDEAPKAEAKPSAAQTVSAPLDDADEVPF